MMRQRIQYVCKMLLGNQTGYWIASVLILLMAGLFVYLALYAGRTAINRFVSLQNGPVTHLTLDFPDGISPSPEAVINAVRALPGVLMARPAVARELEATIRTADGRELMKRVLLTAVDIKPPPLHVTFLHVGKEADGLCIALERRDARLSCAEPLALGDKLVFTSVTVDGKRRSVRWPFVVNKHKGGNLYSISTDQNDGGILQAGEEIDAFRRDFSLSQFVPDMTSTLPEHEKQMVHMLVNAGMRESDTADGAGSAEIPVLMSKPLYHDLYLWGESNLEEFRFGDGQGEEMPMVVVGIFDARLAENENDRVIVMPLALYTRRPGGSSDDPINRIEVRVNNPDKVEATKESIAGRIERFGSPFRARTWKERVPEHSTSVVDTAGSIATLFTAAIVFVSLTAVCSIFFVVFKKTMHQQMLLRVYGLKGITRYYLLIVVSTAIPSALLLCVSASLLRGPLGGVGLKALLITIAGQFGVPFVAAVFLGRYFKRRQLQVFLQE